MAPSSLRPLPQIVVLGTGGTIAGTATGDPSLPGYTAGVLGVEDLLKEVPTLGSLAQIQTEQVANVDSKDMTFAVWTRLAGRVMHWLAQPSIQACVITHGTDTLEETAYFLSLVLPLDKPVVLTAAMRPATALNADGPQNLLDAVRVATHPEARGIGVVCVLHGVVHAARDVAKINTHAVEAFSSGERGPLGEIEGEHLRLWRRTPPESGAPFALPAAEAWPRVELLSNVAGTDGAVVRCLVESPCLHPRLRGLVVAGTGGGTVSRELEAALEAAAAQGVSVKVASRVGPLRGGDDDGLSAVKLRVRLLLELAAIGTPLRP
ncbi:asparaginase [Thiomonas intermedia]|uniref:asparaginase n=1 Tax=Thiomonas intermedia TaxID=926 RepID=UPI001FE8CD93|nr:asparaginase [Thiomonas intermedia]